MQMNKENLNDLYTIKKLPIYKIVEILNKSNIYHWLKKFEIPVSTRKKYFKPSESERRFILENYTEKGSKFCAEKLNISLSCIGHIARKLKIKCFEHKIWSKMDEQFLLDNFSELGRKKCAIALNRSETCIGARAKELNLKKKIIIPSKTHRRCCRCKIEKDFSSYFARNSDKKFGITYCCKKCISETSLKKKMKDPQMDWSKRTHCSHKGRFNSINFTVEELYFIAKNSKNCSFCGNDFCWTNTKPLPNSPSLDRLDNNEDLTLDNISIICRKCNTTKLDRSLEEFRDYIIKILPTITNLINQRSTKFTETSSKL